MNNPRINSTLFIDPETNNYFSIIAQVLFNFTLSRFLLHALHESELARGRERERHFRTGERADSLDRTLFRLPVLALSFYSTNSGHHFAGFPVAIETRGICVNRALVNEIIMFGISPKLISRISRSSSFSYSVYL